MESKVLACSIGTSLVCSGLWLHLSEPAGKIEVGHDSALPTNKKTARRGPLTILILLYTLIKASTERERLALGKNMGG
jgi:hypothetical protein